MDERAAALLWLLLLVAPRGRCQHYLLLRPIPSDSLPLLELKEDPDPLFDPRDRDLNETELRAALGDFDGRFLSVAAPPPPPPPGGEEDGGGSFGRAPSADELDDWDALKLGGALPKELRAVDVDAQLGKRHKSSKKLRRRLQQWLWAYTACPVAHAWTDLGSRFWPRYVRAGSCPSKRSCSVPEGMVCRPAASAHLSLLRWRCVQRKSGLKCAWIPVQYPVITDCKCACAS